MHETKLRTNKGINAVILYPITFSSFTYNRCLLLLLRGATRVLSLLYAFTACFTAQNAGDVDRKRERIRCLRYIAVETGKWGEILSSGSSWQVTSVGFYSTMNLCDYSIVIVLFS